MDTKSKEKLEKVHPVLRERVEKLIGALAAHGLDVRVVQGSRSFAEQDALYNQTRDRRDNDGDGRIDEPDERVTNARGGQSNHNFGLATDLCPFKDGKPDWNDSKGFLAISREAKRLGLESGADWKFVDAPHVQLKGMSIKECQKFYALGGIQKVWTRMDEILAGAKPTQFIPKSEELLEFGDKGNAVRALQEKLFQLGFLRKHEIDGGFGKITKNAVIGFQRLNNLTADGIVGDGTKAKLDAALLAKR